MGSFNQTRSTELCLTFCKSWCLRDFFLFKDSAKPLNFSFVVLNVCWVSVYTVTLQFGLKN